MPLIRSYRPEDAAGVDQFFIELQEFERTLKKIMRRILTYTSHYV